MNCAAVNRGRARLLLLVCLALLAAPAGADSRAAIERQSEQVLQRLQAAQPALAAVIAAAAGALVFPDVVKMGFGTGGEYGEGVLFIDGRAAAYYATAGAQFGLGPDAQFKAEVLLFRDTRALQHFRQVRGWQVGVDGVVKMAGAGALSRTDLQQPIVGFILSADGLVEGLGMDGSRITRIAR